MTGDPRQLTDLVETHKPALVLLDLMLPGTDGIELMQSVPQLADLPVIFISAYGRDETIARALELGAADYIVKPFSPTELTARVRAALRRRAEPERFLLRDLAIDYEQRKVTVAGQSVQLTASEYELLRLLSVNAGRVLTPEALLRRLRGGQDAADSTVVRTLVKKLRRKLGDNAARPALRPDRARGRLPYGHTGRLVRACVCDDLESLQGAAGGQPSGSSRSSDVRWSSVTGFRVGCQKFDLYKFGKCGITLA